MQQQKWLDRGACPACGSSDANVSHTAGYSWCFSCQTRFDDNIITISKTKVKSMATLGEWGEIPERKISLETAKKFNTKIKRNGNITTHHLYGYYKREAKRMARRDTDDIMADKETFVDNFMQDTWGEIDE